MVVSGENVQIQLLNGLRSFRSTAVKPFYEDPEQVDAQRENLLGVTIEPEPEKRPVVKIPPFVPDLNKIIYKDLDVELEAFLTKKETRDRQLSIELRAKGIINTPSELFTLSRKKEINGLLEKEVFKLVPYDSLRWRLLSDS